MDHVVIAAIVMTDILDLAVTVMAGRDHVIRTGCHDLIVLNFAVCPALFRETCLERAAATAAAKIVDAVGHGVDEVFLAHHGFDHKPKIINDLVGAALPGDIAGILNRELGTYFLIPVTVDLQFALPDPLGVKLDNGDEFELVRDVEFAQSFQDREV